MRSIDFTQPGGLPVFQDTLAWLQQAHAEGIGALGLALGSGDFATALTSTVTQPSANQIDWTAGWFLWGGEPVWADAGTLTKGSGQAFFVQRTQIASPTPLNPALYQDGNTHSPYLESRAAFAAGTLLSPPANAKLWGGQIWDFAAKALLMNDLGWREVGASGEPPFLNGWANSTAAFGGAPPLAFRRERNGRVSIRGRVTNAGTVSNNSGQTVVCVLPAEYRPSVVQRLYCTREPGATNVLLYVNSAGEVRFYQPNNAPVSVPHSAGDSYVLTHSFWVD